MCAFYVSQTTRLAVKFGRWPIWLECQMWSFSHKLQSLFVCKCVNISKPFSFISPGKLEGGRGQLLCPICRRQVIIPDEGFPVCFISDYIRDHLNKPGSTGK